MTTTKKTKTIPKLDKRALFSALRYQPHPGQVEVHLSRAKRRVLACGSRWGKTTCAAHEAIAAVLAPCEKSRGWIVAPYYDLASRTFEIVYTALHVNFPHRIKSLNPREYRLTVTNLGGGVSELRVKSADRPTTLLGEALDWLVLDEAARVKGAVWESHLVQRLLDRDGWALLLSTPNRMNWFFREYYRGQRGDPSYASWNMPSWTNPHLDGELIEAERQRLPQDTFDEQYGARFLGSELMPCETCGYPSPSASGWAVTEQGDVLPTCVECAHEIDKDGATLWVTYGPGTEPSLTRVILAPRPEISGLPGMDGDVETN